MADAYASQVYDGRRNLFIKLTDVSDGTGLTGQNVTNISGLVPNPGVHLKLRRVRFAISGMSVRLQWQATTNVDLVLLSPGEDELDFSRDYAGGIPNNGGTGVTGDVLLTTVGQSSGATFTLGLEFIKGV